MRAFRLPPRNARTFRFFGRAALPFPNPVALSPVVDCGHLLSLWSRSRIAEPDPAVARFFVDGAEGGALWELRRPPKALPRRACSAKLKGIYFQKDGGSRPAHIRCVRRMRRSRQRFGAAKRQGRPLSGRRRAGESQELQRPRDHGPFIPAPAASQAKKAERTEVLVFATTNRRPMGYANSSSLRTSNGASSRQSSADHLWRRQCNKK
jgi:hypothetical protein